MNYKVLIPQDISKTGKEYLQEKGYQIKMGKSTDVEQIIEDVRDCDAILARTAKFPAEVLMAGKRLKVIARHGVGVDNIDVEKATELGIHVVNAPESNNVSVAEHTIGLILATAKNIVLMNEEICNGRFHKRNEILGVELRGKILGVIGLGKIGIEVAKIAKYGLGMDIMAYDPFIKQEDIKYDMKLINDWDFVFKNSDFISLHLPVTPKTAKIVASKEFEMMKTTSFLINAARGEVVDEEELIKALKNNIIGGAGLDVYNVEPLYDSPLFDMKNVTLSPHNAAQTKEGMDRMALHAAYGIHEVLSGQTPTWPVNNINQQVDINLV